MDNIEKENVSLAKDYVNLINNAFKFVEANSYGNKKRVVKFPLAYITSNDLSLIIDQLCEENKDYLIISDSGIYSLSLDGEDPTIDDKRYINTPDLPKFESTGFPLIDTQNYAKDILYRYKKNIMDVDLVIVHTSNREVHDVLPPAISDLSSKAKIAVLMRGDW